MSNQVRIAVISTAESPVQQQLQAMPSQPVVQTFSELFTEASAIHAFAPRVLCLEHGPGFQENRGALKILSTLIPDLAVVVICEEAAAAEIEKSGADQALLPVTRPYTLTELHQVVTQALDEQPGVDPESYLQFVQGICDEINNPLMFSSGHLQLRESRLDPHADQSALAQVRAIRKGLSRIDRTMRKVSNMSRASQGDRMHEAFTVETLLAAAQQQILDADLGIAVECPDELRRISIRGDIALLTSALFSLAEVGLEIQNEHADRLSMRLSQSDEVLEVRMLVENANLQAWELPKAFEPYHLNRVLQGTTLGLNLFLVRLVCQAHDGDAVARRLSTTSVEFCISLTPA
ncbi:MAG: hypothetical protein VX951_08090 [Planctomycetota bacterium]|nr:hypothetical protein [Planctomycetota bacterium]